MNNLYGVISQEKEGFLFEWTAPCERGQSPLFKRLVQSHASTILPFAELNLKYNS